MLKFDSKEYVKDYGLVKDEKLAIGLLCETSQAWDVIDPSLKNDFDIIMFFQPMGYTVGGEPCKYKRFSDLTIWSCEPAFGSGSYRDDIIYKDEILLHPSGIRFYRDEDEEYYRVQRILKRNEWVKPCEYNELLFFNKEFCAALIPYDPLMYVYQPCGGGSTHLYKRDNLWAVSGYDDDKEYVEKIKSIVKEYK